LLIERLSFRFPDERLDRNPTLSSSGRFFTAPYNGTSLALFTRFLIRADVSYISIFHSNTRWLIPTHLSLPSHLPFDAVTGFTLSLAKQVLNGHMNSVIKSIARNAGLVLIHRLA
jgi:hypothetical protein